MPYLDGPQARHHGRLTHTVEASSGERQAIGLVYDPSRVAASRIGDELMRKLQEVHREWRGRAELVMAGVVDQYPGWGDWEPWEAVERMVADHPGDILPLPGLYPRERIPVKGWWYESPEEKAKREAREDSLAKGAYIQETGDWAVEGEGAG